ncbi:MAG: Fis family transcriptional regulator, partial [Dehalococcoidia bacterium]|nr:Fis family transcriptional regulator [Dehalococcoidia bacterium]
MKLIELSQGYCAKVDDGDYEMLMSFPKWFAMKHHGNIYAKCNITLENGKRTTLKHRVIMK